MKKHVAYELGVGVGLMAAGTVGLFVQHDKMPWQHDDSYVPKITLETLESGGSAQVEHQPNGAVTDALLAIDGLGTVITCLALVEVIDGEPDRRRTVTPVDIPLLQDAAETEIVHVA